MMTFDPTARLTVEGALAHRWMADFYTGKELGFDGELVTLPRHFPDTS